MDALTLVAGWLLLCALPAVLIARYRRPGEGRFVFLSLVLGPIGLASWWLSRVVVRLETRALRHP